MSTKYQKLPMSMNGSGDPEQGKSSSGTGLEKKQAQNKALITFAVIFYASCSSTMLVINKLAVYHVQAPSFVLFCQVAATAFAVYTASGMGWVKADAFDWAKVKAFFFVVAAFVAAIFTNMKTLQYANVETFIVFRSSTPLLVAFLDFFFLGRCLPSPRSWGSLFFILVGAFAYMSYDSTFEVRSYSWATAWYGVFCFDQIYIKHVCNTVEMTNWGRVLYTNAMSMPLCFLVSILFREDQVLLNMEWNFNQVFFLALSCAAGVGMSYSAFLLRSSVSATSFTVVGIMCKIATVMINLMIWDNHASTEGLGALFICLFAGVLYRQAPMRNSVTSK
ncbi:solute carrier protein [Chloropicon primus]|uniref:Solute carrier protein n=1 Tax=Chloropicon primus TaxID=1764295 RepID=A0A5B8MM23_9CHLO|nr:solute carrier protein [Chloropicon primus]UPR00709.1 solute carrier protein [Chloropicon primus]|eukprot:QDZ21499.1 solute carrier protein [Chloropicon primus]